VAVAKVIGILDVSGLVAAPADAPGQIIKHRPSSITDRTAKQAYFMKKDLELTAKKQAADKKKAKYMKESGGLKYTALAMASRSDEES
jgi:hypothetical protein